MSIEIGALILAAIAVLGSFLERWGRFASLEVRVEAMEVTLMRISTWLDARDCADHGARLTECERRLAVLETGRRHDATYPPPP